MNLINNEKAAVRAVEQAYSKILDPDNTLLSIFHLQILKRVLSEASFKIQTNRYAYEELTFPNSKLFLKQLQLILLAYQVYLRFYQPLNRQLLLLAGE